MSDWYDAGLSFSCTGCGKCCTGSPGAVWLNEAEIETLANHLKLSREDFIDKYTRLIEGKRSLIEDPIHYDCVFLRDKRCEVYEARPVQCRTYPWWTQNLKSKKDWEEAAKFCEGISPSAPKDSLKVIKESLHEYENARSRCRKEREP
ncbi:MAG: YkgJ family cysteine cluster protein, partial [Parachlamydiaceae bacterium]